MWVFFRGRPDSQRICMTPYDWSAHLFKLTNHWFNISTQLSSIWPIHRILLDATTPGQSGSGTDGNKRVLRIPQSISGALPSDFSVISRKPVGWVLPLCRHPVGVFCSPSWRGLMAFIGGVLPLSRDTVGVFCSPSWVGYFSAWKMLW